MNEDVVYPLINQCVGDIVRLMCLMYSYMGIPRRHIRLSVNQYHALCEWIIDKYSKYFRTVHDFNDEPRFPIIMDLTVTGISFKAKSIFKYYEYPLNIYDVMDDVDEIMSIDYYNINNTIIYNNDIFESALSIYLVPFDCMTLSYYEIQSKLDAVLSS